MNLKTSRSLHAASVVTIGVFCLRAEAGFANASFHLGGGTFSNLGNATGWRFTPTSDIIVNELGYFDADQDGLAESHEVGLFRVSDGAALGGTTILAGFGSPLIGDSRFEPTPTPMELTAGVEYYLLANNNLIDDFVFGQGNVGFAPQIDWLGFVEGSANDFSDPIFFGRGVPGNLGPNFLIVPGLACPWDCDGGESIDGTVGIVDFLTLLAQWGGPGSCDFDGGGVGINDFLELLANWGPCP
ncbi:MAG: hypothetical protein O6768_06610 [Planctomycetota bacterium]|nr:hypothetical protein [Planctomycetota bacterium]